MRKKKKRIRGKIRGGESRLRLSVFRSHKKIYAQLIDDRRGRTLVAASEKELAKKKATKTDRARLVGKILGEKAAKLKLKKVAFDRGSCKYLGRVKALAEGAREGGLEF